MGKIIRNGVIYTGSSDESDKIHYNNSKSDLDSTTVQGALDELANEKFPKAGGILGGEIDVANVVNFRNKGYVGSFGNEAILLAKSQINPVNGRYLTIANQDVEPEFKNGLSIVEITGDDYNVKRVYTEANPPSAEVVGAVQRDVFHWQTKSTDSLCTYVINLIAQGYRSGVVQLECGTYGKPKDVPTSISNYFICKFQKHSFDFIDFELIEDAGTQFYYNSCLIGEGVFVYDKWKCNITNDYAHFTETVQIQKDEYPNIVLTNSDTSGAYSKLEYDKGHLGIYTFGNDGESYRGITVKNADFQSEIRYALTLDNKKEDGTYETFSIFGQHNKPTGSYTGTGSAEARVIKTGGIGRAVIITSAKGTALLTTTGGLTFNSTGVNGVIDTQVKFDSTTGEIKLWTTNMFFNESGISYTYQVL